MTVASQFPDAAITILRTTRWNPRADSYFDGMSGGLVWEDEFPREAIDSCTQVDNWAFRYVIGYRASLIRGEPREELRGAWDQLIRECPDWPGFRPERRLAELKDRLGTDNARFMTEFESFISQLGSKEVGTIIK